LDVRNGNNTILVYFNAQNNPNLYCIDVDDDAFSTFNWTGSNFVFDSQHYFSNNCNPIYGCTDLLACNYDVLATIDNNSCIYSNTGTTSVTACDSYDWNGTVYTTSGNYDQTFTNAAGCDSVHTLVATIDNSTTSTDNVGTHCDSYTWIDGNTYTTSNNSATFISTNAAGCDNVATLNLTILPIPSATIYQNSSSLSVIPNAGFSSYTYFWSTGETTQSITPVSFGIYWAFVTVTNGCNSDTVFYNYSTTAINEINTTKQLLRITDLLGQETPYRKNTPLFYIYNDGTVEKRIVIE
jgi:hypothetical protein